MKCLDVIHLLPRRRMSSTLSVATMSGQNRWVSAASCVSFNIRSRLCRTLNESLTPCSLAFLFSFGLHEVIRCSTLATIFPFQYVSQLSGPQNAAAAFPSALWTMWYYSRPSNALENKSPPPPSLLLFLSRVMYGKGCVGFLDVKLWGKEGFDFKHV